MVLETLTEFWSWLCSTSCYFRSMDELAILLLGVCCFFLCFLPSGEINWYQARI